MNKAKKVGLGILAILILLIVIGVLAQPNESEPTQKTTQSTETEPTVKTVNKGEEIQVGEVRWKVLNVEKKSSISNGFQKVKPGGVFVIIDLRAELLGKESGTIDSGQLKIVDSQNRVFEHSTDGQTALELSGEEGLFLKQVHPNVPIEGYAVFDVPTDATGLKLKIEDFRLLSSKYGYVNLGI
ncbi:DUF4352 domain-containing protein [bacterium]|nr:DUF4352 domain-containing protein [bacterium]